MKVCKFKLSDIKKMRAGRPHEYICFTMSRMVGEDAAGDALYPRSKDVIEKFRELVPEAFSNVPYHDVGVITAYLSAEFRSRFRSEENGTCRDALVKMALEKHGDIELEFEVAQWF